MKSTRLTADQSNALVFHMSVNELEAARQYPDLYQIYCVFGVGQHNATSVLPITQFYKHLREGTLSIAVHVGAR